MNKPPATIRHFRALQPIYLFLTFSPFFTHSPTLSEHVSMSSAASIQVYGRAGFPVPQSRSD
jgi:hypothetical protein